jgi:tetratricopeptide (TPR) repeat protein
LGDYAAAHDHFQKSLALYDPGKHGELIKRFGQHPWAAAEIWDALALWILGRIDESLRLADRALADAGSAEHPPTLAYVQLFRALLGLLRRSAEATAAASQALADIVSQYGLAAAFAGYATFNRGWASWSRSGGEVGLAEMRNGIVIQREQGLLSFLPPQEAAVAEAEAAAGEVGAGLRRVEAALAEAERMQHSSEVEMHRIRAEILLKRDPTNTAAAEQSLQAAIAIAQSQKARSFELRAALSLAKLYRAANRDADAHAVLAPAVEGFPPTRQFPELTEAQALLAALSR